jgi:hypothetical protein
MSTYTRAMYVTTAFAAVLALLATAYSAYKGHADDNDINALLSAYPVLTGW